MMCCERAVIPGSSFAAHGRLRMLPGRRGPSEDLRRMPPPATGPGRAKTTRMADKGNNSFIIVLVPCSY